MSKMLLIASRKQGSTSAAAIKYLLHRVVAGRLILTTRSWRLQIQNYTDLKYLCSHQIQCQHGINGFANVTTILFDFVVNCIQPHKRMVAIQGGVAAIT